MESEEKADDMVIEASGNIDAVVTESGETITQEKDEMIKSTGNLADFRKNEAAEKAIDMAIEATGNVEGVIADSRKKEAAYLIKSKVIQARHFQIPPKSRNHLVMTMPNNEHQMTL